MPTDVTDVLIACYCLIDDSLKRLFNTQSLRKAGPAPALTDAEVITIAVVAELQGQHTDKAIWSYASSAWKIWFPRLGSRSAFVRQLAGLWSVVQSIQTLLVRWLQLKQECFHVVDGFPIRVCRLARAARCRLFAGDAAKGYCAAQKEYFYGFKGHVVTTEDGWIVGMAVAAANVDERDAALDTVDGLFGWLIGDKGYISQEFWATLGRMGLLVRTPLRKNMVDPEDDWKEEKFGERRRIVETVIEQFVEGLGLKTMKARDLWHLTARVGRKVLAHTLANLLCWKAELRPTQHAKLFPN